MDGSGAEGLTRDHVVWAYRLLLGREPESDAVIDHHLSDGSRRELLLAFVGSNEFQEHNPEFPVMRGPVNRIARPMQVDMAHTEAQLSELIDRVAAAWRTLGDEKPHWSVLSSDRFLPDQIRDQEDAFHASGAGDVGQLLDILAYVGRPPEQFDTIVEYGCGLGRMTNHLAQHFGNVSGCDISSSHLALARAYSERLGRTNIRYREISDSQFALAEPIDLWFSVIVLQHNPPPVIAAILRRCFSLLRPGGLAIFQVPTYRPSYRFVIDEYIERPQGSEFEMHILPQRAVFDICRDTGCFIVDILEDDRAGKDWISSMFIVGRDL